MVYSDSENWIKTHINPEKRMEDMIMNVQTFCQSCSMPICDEKMKGTKADGSVSDDYCTYCYQKGSFTYDVNMDEMIEICVPHMVNSGMPEKEARTLLATTLPNLDRWK